MRLAPDVFWRAETDCILVSTATGVMRLDDAWCAAWHELVAVSASEKIDHDLDGVSERARELLAMLVSDGTVLVGAKEAGCWQRYTLGHLPTTPTPRS